MDIIKTMDQKADSMLAKVGIKNHDVQNLIELGGDYVGGVYVIQIMEA